MTHVTDVDVRFIHCEYGGTKIMHHQEFQWVCSCDRRGEWVGSSSHARAGAISHVKSLAERSRR